MGAIVLNGLFVVGLALGLVSAAACARPAYTQSLAQELADGTVYLPVVLRDFPFVPAAPVLYPIGNDDGDGNYTVHWSSSEGASTYTLQEATKADFSDATTAYSGPNTSRTFSGKAAGTYYYRVRAAAADGSSVWSNVRQVTVSPPMAEVYVQNDTGGELCYTVDNTGIGTKCFSSGTHLYGTFPSGTYTWHVSAWCGSMSDTEYYAPGVTTYTFWCE